jgi:hypothetical protein
MLRLCGAHVERKAREAAACWCHGLFCGRGGAKRTREFRMTFKSSAALVSVSEMELVMSQADLFDSNSARDRWHRRLIEHGAPRRPQVAHA